MTQNQEKEIKANNSKRSQDDSDVGNSRQELSKRYEIFVQEFKEKYSLFFFFPAMLHGCGILALRPRSQFEPLQGKYEVLTTGPQGKSQENIANSYSKRKRTNWKFKNYIKKKWRNRRLKFEIQKKTLCGNISPCPQYPPNIFSSSYLSILSSFLD